MTANEYIVRYGLPGYVGRFTAAPELHLDRDAAVVVRSPRGEELGVVRCAASERFSAAIDPAAGGQLLRASTPDDERRSTAHLALAGRVLDAAHGRTTAAFLDAEPLHDGSAVILHALPGDDSDLTPLLDELSVTFGVAVRLFDASRALGSPEPPERGCGKPGCGSGGGCSTGGCSTGKCGTSSCSSGKVKSADELTAYFADLRAKMEADTRRTSLHG